MENLKANSIKISGSIIICWPQQADKEEVLDVTEIGSKFNGKYSVNNSTICFVSDHEVFVTPYTREAMKTLTDAGFYRKDFHVPFSNWDYPRDDETKWRLLQRKAREAHYRNYIKDCIEWCDEHGIGELSEDTMERCLMIPHEGVPVHHLHYDCVYYPLCAEYFMDFVVIEKLGKYCTNNGKVVFVYRDGHTYVTKGYGIVEELKSAGYKPFDLFVPFSNGEQIRDEYIAAKWDQIPKK